MKNLPRTKRVSVVLHRAISDIIRTKLIDPRIGKWVTVSEVVLSRDLSSAKVFITLLDTSQKHEESVATLNKASKFIRSQLCEIVDLKYIPSLRFIVDETIVHGEHISKLIDSVSDDLTEQ